MPPRPRAAWEQFADTLLQRAALACRVGGGRPPRDFAGLYVDDADVDRILSELPGLDGPPVEAVHPVLDTIAPRVAQARAALHASLSKGSLSEGELSEGELSEGGCPSADSPFSRIVRGAHLDAADAEVLALLAAVELDPGRQQLVVYLQDSVHLPRVTLALLRRVLPGALGAVAPGGRLARGALVTVEGEGAWATRTVGLAPRVAWALVGDGSPDPALPPGARRVARVAPTGASLPSEQHLLLVSGADRASRRQEALARLAGPAFLVSPAPADPTGWDAIVREASLDGLGVVLELEEDLSVQGRHRIEAAGHLAWALCSPRELGLDRLPDRPWTEVRAPEGQADPDDWLRVLGVPDGTGHQLDREQLALVARAAAGLGGDIDGAVRRLAGGHLNGLAVRIRPGRSWDDLVLPAEGLEQLRELGARYRHRHTVYQRWGFGALPSAGLVAVFAGPSGTGKTLAAEVLAADIGLDLHKVDLSAVVSKYIGETEKNLERIFDAAAAGNVVLFFDEADALFGKRSEVGDAHDRYANIEVSYLLQRLEHYDGLVVLATKLQRNMDPAFLRRIHVAVEFALPDEDGRRAIWQRCFPPGCPVADLDLDFLARQFKLSGGSIRNVALSAAFLAAEADSPVVMDLVLLAVKREFGKLGRLRTPGEFDRSSDLVRAGEPAGR